MVTVMAYVALKYLVGEDWSNWLMVIPVILDLSIVGVIDRMYK